ncbi:MAG: hypothetical protein VYB58_01030 [Verrucomicrobiota bacterium]|nr:hypothetical protein [Verrucomicrobiota bacterium]
MICLHKVSGGMKTTAGSGGSESGYEPREGWPRVPRARRRIQKPEAVFKFSVSRKRSIRTRASVIRALGQVLDRLMKDGWGHPSLPYAWPSGA